MFRYENKGYEKFLMRKRAIEASIDEANLAAQPTQKFKSITRALMGGGKKQGKTTLSRPSHLRPNYIRKYS